MADFKLVISDPKSGLSVQREAKEQAAQGFLGMKIGDAVKGELIDLHGYEFLITGGSDYCGFPMRKDVAGTSRKRILAYEGVGIKKQEKGMLQRKTVCGNTIHDKTVQVNLKVVKSGAENIFAGAGKKKEGEAGAKKEEKPAEESKPKEHAKKEEKGEKAEVKKEHKAEAKPEAKAEPSK